MIEEELWKNLTDIPPQEVAVRAEAEYDERNRTFSIRVFNETFVVDTNKKLITGSNQRPGSHLLPLFLLQYLACAKDIPLSNVLVSPHQLTGGNFFFRASHELPLHRIAEKFENDLEGFTERGLQLGGEEADYGDAAVKMYLLPRIPLIFVFWKKDREFESRVHLILDKSIEEQMNLESTLLALLYAIGKMVGE